MKPPKSWTKKTFHPSGSTCILGRTDATTPVVKPISPRRARSNSSESPACSRTTDSIARLMLAWSQIAFAPSNTTCTSDALRDVLREEFSGCSRRWVRTATESGRPSSLGCDVGVKGAAPSPHPNASSTATAPAQRRSGARWIVLVGFGVRLIACPPSNTTSDGCYGFRALQAEPLCRDHPWRGATGLLVGGLPWPA